MFSEAELEETLETRYELEFDLDRYSLIQKALERPENIIVLGASRRERVEDYAEFS